MARILMVSTHGYVAARAELGKPDTGGQVVYVLELSKALARQGNHVDIVTRQFGDRSAHEMVSDGVQIHRFPCGGPGFIPKEALSRVLPEWVENLRQCPIIADRDYAFICSHYWDAGIAGLLLAREWNIPHVHVPHSIGVLKREKEAWGKEGPAIADNLDERIHRERVVYHRSDLVVATVAEQARCLTESDEYSLPTCKVVQIPPGYDDALFHPVSEARRFAIRQRMRWSAKTIFAAGRLAPNKGYDLLLQAMPAIHARVRGARLVLAIGSESPEKSELKMLNELRSLAEELGILSQITIRPCLPQSELPDYYRAADVFVLCSRYEPFGMTAIEAMACGTPTIVTTHGGLWEELTGGLDCICCDPRDPQELAQDICLPLLHSGLRCGLSRYGLETVKARYLWPQIASQLLEAVNCATATERALEQVS